MGNLGYCPGPSSLQFFINDLDKGIERMFNKSANVAKLEGGGELLTPQKRSSSTKDLYRLEYWALSNQMQLKGEK